VIQLPAHPITFADFMERCLYDPHGGYYTSGRPVFGPPGDFYTSSHTHPLFAEILADAIAALQGLLESAPPLDLVELGPGDGVLGRNILAHLSHAHPKLAGNVRYSPVELNTPLPKRICGIVFSNEFFDALPVHRVRVKGGELRELYVEADPSTGEIRETEGPISDDRIRDYMRNGFERRREGWDYEVNLRMLDWLGDLNRRIDKGYVITIDYGFLKEEYEQVDRAAGTVLSYSRHRVVTDPYLNPGRQDITAHVNFSVLIKTAREMGWTERPLKNQREFMMEWGLAERLIRAEQSFRKPSAQKIDELLHLKRLLLPGGISDVMKVLLQGIRVK